MNPLGPSPRRLPVRSGPECRCHCGNLLARLSVQGIELKCRRCKRVVILPLPTGARDPPESTRTIIRL